MNKILKAQIIRVYGAQYKFARALDIQETIVSAVIRGRRELDPGSQKQWARLLKSDVGELFPDARN